MTTRTTPAWLPLAAVGCTLLFWASAFVAIRHLAVDFTPGSMSLGRLLVGAACLAVVALAQGVKRPTATEWRSLVIVGLLWFGLYNVALNAGERLVDAGTAAMLIQVSPVLIAVLAAVFLHERFTAPLVTGLALAFTGVALIAFATPDNEVIGEGSYALGVVLCLVSAVAYSISLVLQKPLVSRLSAVQVTWMACTIGAIGCLPFLGDLVDQVGSAPASSIWWLAYLGVFPTAIAFTTYAFALQHMSASSLGVTTYMVPPITIALGAVLLGETPPTLAYVGGVLALVGVAVARRSPRGRRRKNDELTDAPTSGSGASLDASSN